MRFALMLWVSITIGLFGTSFIVDDADRSLANAAVNAVMLGVPATVLSLLFMWLVERRKRTHRRAP